jgi:tetratricopeptide (TPR) repeat protein
VEKNTLEKATKEKFPETGQTKTFQLDSKAMTQYALGSSKLIASLLIIPDAFALVPNSLNFTSWALKLLGLWVSAAVLWFVSFNGILQLVKLLTDGVRINNDGIYPWRLAKLIRWQDIEAVAIEERAIFSRVFFLTPKAKRLTLFVAKENENRLVPNYLPSFLFAKESFEEIIKLVTLKKFGVSPTSNECIFATDSGARKMAATNRLLTWQRLLVSGIVATSLTMFLGRKAFVNYSYNSGNKAIAHQQYDLAKRLYEQAIGADPAFAFGWESLARAQLALGQTEEAKKDWTRALFLKPDYVEARLGLARLALRQGKLNEAKSLIDAALGLAPQNKQALLMLATYDWRIGRIAEAYKIADDVIANTSIGKTAGGFSDLGDEDQIALCLLANLDLSQQRLPEARQIVTGLEGKIRSKYVQLLYQEAKVRELVSEGEETKAIGLLNQSLRSAPDDVPLNTVLFKIALSNKDLKLAKKCLVRLTTNKNEDVESRMSEARFYILNGEKNESKKTLESIAETKNVAPDTLNEVASLLNQIGAHQSAVDAAAKAILLDHDNPDVRPLEN